MPATRGALGLMLLAATCSCRSAQPAPSPSGDPAWIDFYSGWRSPLDGSLYARVHRGRPPPPARPDQASLTRLEQTLRALELSAIDHAHVRVEGVQGLQSAVANSHGLLVVPLPAFSGPVGAGVRLVLDSPGWEGASVESNIPTWSDDPGLGVISDIDDTITDTGVTHKAKMLLGTFFHSEYEVRVFPGCPEVIRPLASSAPGESARPLFYLSGSPWGLHGRIQRAFDLAGLPRGAVILRSLSGEPFDPYAFKKPHLERITAAFPHRRWVLFGDSGEKDPEVYRALRDEHPERVAEIFIHDVTAEPHASPRFEGMTVFDEWGEIAAPVAGLR